MSHFIPEPRKFSDVTRLQVDVKKDWLKATLKEITSLIKNKNFILDDPENGEQVSPCMHVYKETINMMEVLTS